MDAAFAVLAWLTWQFLEHPYVFIAGAFVVLLTAFWLDNRLKTPRD